MPNLEVVDRENKLRLYATMYGEDKNFPVEIVAHDINYRDCLYLYLSKEEAKKFCQEIIDMIEADK